MMLINIFAHKSAVTLAHEPGGDADLGPQGRCSYKLSCLKPKNDTFDKDNGSHYRAVSDMVTPPSAALCERLLEGGGLCVETVHDRHLFMQRLR